MKQFMLDYAAQLERSGVDPASLMWFDVSECAAKDFDVSVPIGTRVNNREIKRTFSASVLDQPPPFPKCAFVGSFVRDGVEYSAFMAVVGGNPREDGVRVSCVRRAVSQSDLRSKYMTIPPIEYSIDETGMIFSGYVEPVDESTWTKKELNSILISLGSVYEHFTVSPTVTGYKPTVRPGLINQKRKKKGKPLFYDWVTVNIEPPKPRSLPKGGTHASPRHHDRRGHFRTLRSGKKVWVKNHKVGNPANGTVFHDYQLGNV